MSKKFILFVDEEFTKEERNAITAHFKNRYAYWHWVGNVWLLTTSREDDTTNSIRNEMMSIVNRGSIVVLDVSQSSGWSAFGQKKKFKWLHNNWNKKPESFPELEDSDL
ncbi:hypothetical protein Q7267_10665 [Glaesserella parasuis]|uniref:hypothetical protein n=1 Tax=Glaesserella parasuis TaxID=738 RepID=UPI0003ABD7E9|nr:hypothetical protein [Glaesserella parasuis]EQA13940.1 hypothetical protein HPSSW140_0266 [Glaesserella parasuis SW140]KDD79381.1 hypothetical protein HPS42_10300 [Glaesserella parasuis ST4-2]MCT8559101.1 hypothetical protein [Glaesserella parasuis]MCT8581648.1 hypothetical protein [Glaesserella parasuis]MCT8585573.1 hypothetical protein [Glaesserella parasuis]